MNLSSNFPDDIKIEALLLSRCPCALFTLSEQYLKVDRIYFKEGTMLDYKMFWQHIDRVLKLKAGHGYTLQSLLGKQYLGVFNCRYKDFIWPGTHTTKKPINA
jgi:hypothetical protein